MQTYVVSSGDTLYGIASKYGVSVNDIKTANNLKNNNFYSYVWINNFYHKRMILVDYFSTIKNIIY